MPKDKKRIQKNISGNNKFLSTRAAADFLQTTPRQIRNLVWQGRLSYYKPFGRLLFSRVELEKLVADSSNKGGNQWQ